jgi:DNA segregation ATPase FtsK/SpoIIIE-like protein
VQPYTPKSLHIYIADFGSGILGAFAGLAHSGGVVFAGQKDAAQKLMRLLRGSWTKENSCSPAAA